MQIRLLGPVQLRGSDGPVPIGPRVRVVLAALALNPGRAVSVDRLVAAVWPERPPATATAQIQACVSVLRRAVAAVGRPARDVVVTTPPGYMLSAGPDEVDVLQFERGLADAGAAAAHGDPERAAGLLREALARWRGRALEGFPGLAAEATRLEERRLAALEKRFDADLACGRHADVIPELVVVVAEHPLRERFRVHLVRALHRAGRRSEALEVYQDGRRSLIEELGLEPGPELRRAQRDILAADPAVLAQPVAPIRQVAGGPSPLPSDVADFLGRRGEVAAVVDALTGRTDPCGAVPAVAVTGPGGVGKTTLAVHVAHRLRDLFRDGRLYADLHGTGGDAAGPGEVLGRLLRRLGVQDGAIPRDTEERAELYRASLDGRRVLVVLDNAAGEAQVRPLLPGSGTCAVVITSRRRLTGLPGAVTVELDAFTEVHATALLGRIAGRERVSAEPAAARRIAELCDRLPLALRIAGARLAAKPHWRLEELAARLGEEDRRLDELAHADLGVRESLRAGDETISPPARRVLRLLSLLDSEDFRAGPAAALADVPVAEAEELVEELVDARLLQVTGRDPAGRTCYRFPGLVRVYARERAACEDSPDERRRALSRALTTPLLPAVREDLAGARDGSDAQHGRARWPAVPAAGRATGAGSGEAPSTAGAKGTVVPLREPVGEAGGSPVPASAETGAAEDKA
jgi:DNA-binding SARP family transcriptional activator